MVQTVLYGLSCAQIFSPQWNCQPSPLPELESCLTWAPSHCLRTTCWLIRPLRLSSLFITSTSYMFSTASLIQNIRGEGQGRKLPGKLDVLRVYLQVSKKTHTQKKKQSSFHLIDDNVFVFYTINYLLCVGWRFLLEMAVCIKCQHLKIYFLHYCFNVDNSTVRICKLVSFEPKGNSAEMFDFTIQMWSHFSMWAASWKIT